LHDETTLALPPELQALHQFVFWRQKQRPDKPKPAKVPLCPATGRPADITNRDAYGSFQQALAANVRYRGDGIGLVLTDDDPYAAIDLDQCIDAAGNLSPSAAKTVSEFHTFTELSFNGRGLHLYFKGSVAGGGRRFNSIECYSKNRYLCVTGDHISGTPLTVETRQAQLDALLATFPAHHPPVFTPTAKTIVQTARPTGVVNTGGGVCDAVLLKARNARNGDRFDRLFAGDTSDYGGDWSRADMALVGMLCYWADGDPVVVDALFRRSGLYRPKWDDPRASSTYGWMTISRALQSR